MKTLISVVCFLLVMVGNACAATNDRAVIEAAKKAISVQLKDPYSAKFEGIYVKSMEDGSPIVCGTVNAKNSYGAYGGMKEFYYAGGRASIVANRRTSAGIIFQVMCEENTRTR